MLLFLSFLVFSSPSYSVEETLLCEAPSQNFIFENIQAVSSLSQKNAFCESRNTCFEDQNLYIDLCDQPGMVPRNNCEGLNPAELAAIEAYTSDGYGPINSSIWSGSAEKCDGVIEVLNQGLSKIPKYNGWVFRGTDLPAAVREQHKKGELINYAAFTSTSTTSGWGGQDQFMIYSQNGSSIDSVSSCEGEDEVLFPADTNFKVLEVIHDIETDKKLFIMVEEAATRDNNKYQEIQRTVAPLIQKLKKQADESFFYLDNEFNYSGFQSDSRWECSTGTSSSDITPELRENVPMTQEQETEYLSSELENITLSISEYKEVDIEEWEGYTQADLDKSLNKLKTMQELIANRLQELKVPE